MSSHHKTKSPSSFPAKNICPSYEGNDFVEEAARKGTILHKCFENLISKGSLDLSSKDMIELVEKDGVFEADFALIKQDDLDGLIWAEAALNEVLRITHPQEARTIQELIKDGVGFAEKKLPIVDEKFDELTFGTIDVSVLNIVADLKTGRIRNYREQMAAYALAKFQELPFLENVIVVELYSSQRKFFHYSFTLEEAEEIVYSISKKIDNKEKLPRKQNDYCVWCKNRTICPEIVGKVAKIQENREEFPKNFSFSSSEVSSKAIAALQAWRQNPDDEQLRADLVVMSENLAFLYEAATAAEAFFDGVKEMIKKAMIEGVAIEGLRLNSRAGKSKLTQVQKIFELSGLSAEEFLNITSVSLTDLSNALSEPSKIVEMFDRCEMQIPEKLKGKRVLLTKTNAPKALKYLLDENGLIEKGENTFSIAREKEANSLRSEDLVYEEIQELKGDL